ncbi:tetratricopeptide repeat protein [Yoonia sp. 208BN28-4]|uniref:tetratricopeptide repeat protein n=1 Tax=Yoonia sp. 208BN28-4 TaxID=3126505 RepID=UPI0030ED5843
MLATIYTELNGPDGQFRNRQLSAQLWEIWTDAPDAKAQALLDEGMRKREGFDLAGASETLDELIAYCPDYAEGYNQRAFANFLRQDFDAALVDLDRALELLPNHVAALSGKGLTLMGLGRTEEAQEALRAAVALNPWLSERSLIIEPPGQDI